jgi:hypothetical protein
LYLIIGKKDKNPQRFQEQEEEEAEEGEAEEGEPSEPKKRSLYKYTISFFDFRF